MADLKPSKHGRDHCPGGEDPIPCLQFPYIYRETTTVQSINSGVPWTQVLIGAGTTVNQDITMFGITGADSDLTDIKKVGRYGFKFQLKWEDSFAGLTGMRVASSSAFGWHMGMNWEEPGGASGDGAVAPILYFERRVVGGTSAFELNICQFSGVAQNLSSASFEIAYLGHYTGTADQY